MAKLNVEVFADGADIEEMKAAYKNKQVDGFTTNPSLMAKAGVTDYKAFAEEAVREIPDASISFEVFADDLETMAKEAEILKQYDSNILFKIQVVKIKDKKTKKNKKVDVFTTNPSLMEKAGVTDYKAFAEEAVREIPDASISFEVFADDLETMAKEAEILKQYGSNVFVKIPVVNTKGESTISLIKKLSAENVRLNITAVYTLDKVNDITDGITEDDPTDV